MTNEVEDNTPLPECFTILMRLIVRKALILERHCLQHNWPATAINHPPPMSIASSIDSLNDAVHLYQELVTNLHLPLTVGELARGILAKKEPPNE